MSPFASGRSGGLMWADGSTTKRNISQYINSVDYHDGADVGDITTFNTTQNAKAYVPGLRDRTVSFEGFYDPTVDGYLNGALNKSKPFTYYAATTAATANTFMRRSGNAILTSYDINTGVDGPITFSGEAQITGAVTRSTASS